MADFTRNFIAGRMNKVVDQRLLPEGEYVDAMNVRMGSTENAEVGVIENTKGNISLTSLTYLDGTPLSTEARCIGAIDDSANEMLYWFVHDPAFPVGATGKLDLIVSYNVLSEILTYHIISIDDGGGVYTTLNFNPAYLITGINIIADLLFWTDDYNAPRFINIRPTSNRYPNPISNIDELDPEAILVIKKPPVESPTIELINTPGQQNYLETRFISFAYRYKYVDGEYSATSQWSEPAFIPKAFQFDTKSMLNIGMLNSFNTARINYNTGGPLVVGIDLLFKKTNNNIIKIIEQINKVDSSFGNYQIQPYTFDNSKIFTILNEAEILRLYDNVPRFAKAQTIMGNRLMYGNYVENYDLKDATGATTKIEYGTTLISESIGYSLLNDTQDNGLYKIDPSAIDTSIENCILNFDLSGVSLIEGSSLSIDMTINHSSFTGFPAYPTETTTDVTVSFTFLLQRQYNNVYDLASSPEFQAAIGTVSNIKPVYILSGDDSCDGSTMTDFMNCAIPQLLGPFQKYASGINGTNEPIKIITSPGSDIVGFQIIAMEFVEDVLDPVSKIFEYYEITEAQVTFQEIANTASLHSNRGYEVGLIYMDEFNRATTSLVSTNNAIYVPCEDAGKKNSIQVTIPVTQRAPSWAKRYKFVIKPDEENYETIYSNIFFQDPDSNNAYLLLEGENARKVETGDTLNIKSDTRGIIQNCTTVTVLEKKVQERDFLTIANVSVPSGVYMKVLPNNFNLEVDENSVINPGLRQTWASGGYHAYLSYPMNIPDPAVPGHYIDYTVPAGSIILWNVLWRRIGGRNNCPERGYLFQKRLVATRDYANMYEWFVGDNIDLILNTGVSKGFVANKFLPGTDLPIPYDFSGTNTSVAPYKLICVGGNFSSDIIVGSSVYNNSVSPATVAYVVSVDSTSQITLTSNIFTSPGSVYSIVFYPSNSLNYWKFYRNAGNNQLSIIFSSTESCDGSNFPQSRRVYIYATIEVLRADNLISFETQPSDALPNVFFENNLSFEIDAFGNHLGGTGDTSQDILGNIPAVINTGFFNCFAFGNGVESYKIRDSILGMSFNFGERVTTVAAQDYKTADRFSDITYSGIYNGESNINKLNEFNLGLSNFKHCEASFGDIQLLDGRNTDILVLQEDKISYVLGDKNLLSDASAGGIITASPMVLGTQIARTEKYGISFNPESYIQWGFDRFFTDAKRGAVLQLKGGETQAEELVAISNQNMRTWFRDKFNDSFNTQKLGGFDPYMNEYVLCMNDQLLPTNPQCLSCGIFQTFTLSFLNEISPKTKTYCIDLGAAVGYTTIDWEIISIEEGATLTVEALYNGVITSSGPVDIDGQISFEKNLINIETAQITLTYTGDMVVNMFAGCPTKEPMGICQVVVTNDSDAGQSIHNQYRYYFGDFISPLISNLVTFISGTGSPLVSSYGISYGVVGEDMPPEGSTMRLLANQIFPDNYVFNTTQDKFRYFRSSVLYDNNTTDINNLLIASTISTPILGASPTYYSDFIVPPSIDGEYLYLIWDLRDSILTELCYVADNATNPCCDCHFENYYLSSSFSSATSIYKDADLTIFADNGFYSTSGVVRELVDGVLLPAQVCVFCPVAINLCLGSSLQDVCCSCSNACTSNYVNWIVNNPNAYEVIVGFYNAEGIYQEIRVPAVSYDYVLCSVGMPTCSNTNVEIIFHNCECA